MTLYEAEAPAKGCRNVRLSVRAIGMYVEKLTFSREIEGCRRVMIRFPVPLPHFVHYEAV